MNILIVADWDHSGAGYALAEAVNENTEHKARHVMFTESYLGYPHHILRPSIVEMRELVAWADVVNLHDSADRLIPKGAAMRPVFTTYHGSEYRNRWAYFNCFDRAVGRIATALTLDIALMGPAWLPRPIPDLSYMHSGGNGTFRVAHAPSNRAVKDTETVIQVLGDLDGIELDIIEGVANDECVARKARADLLVEEFKLGYGTGSLEGWALGIPVIANAIPQILSYMRTRLDPLPFVATPLENLRQTVKDLRDDKELYAAARDKGRAYWEQYHRPDVVAEKFIRICEKQINGGDK